ncbi:dihydropteroate synthase [bacterium]|nr:dihydropteroate synthase [bacterium]
MGIVNLSPDSFFPGSRVQGVDHALAQMETHLEQGADLIDVGAVSSRPGAQPVSEREEWNRLEPVLRAAVDRYPGLRLSVDTFRASIAERAADMGVALINDISAGRFDPRLWEVVAERRLAYVLMHMQGEPSTMQRAPHYTDVVLEQIEWMAERLHALRALGIADVLIDPGFGFGKRLEDNYRILARLEDYRMLEAPILVGVSRKSMIYKALNIDVAESLDGTTALHALAVASGALMLRVHEVKPARQAIDLAHLWQSQRLPSAHV